MLTMPNRITESDRRRMAEFANTPRYERDPELLTPDDGEDEDEDE